MPFIVLMRLLLIATCFLILSCKSPKREYKGIANTTSFIYTDSTGRQGLLDSNHNVILSAQFNYTEDWLQFGMLRTDSGGKTINGGDYVGYDFRKYGLIKPTGEVLFRPQFDDITITDYSARVLKDSFYGFLDTSGKWLIKPRYDWALPFYKGTAVVKDGAIYKLINKQGELVTKEVFDTVWGFKNGISVVEKNRKWGLVNYRGQFILPLDNYRGIGDYNWYYGVYRKDDLYYVIDTAGKLPIKEGFDDVVIRGNEDSVFAIGSRRGVSYKIRLK